MPDTVEELAFSVLRTSGFLTAAFVLVWSLLRLTRVRSARVHTLAWSGVLLQGLLLFSLNIDIPIITVAESTCAGQLSSPPATVEFKTRIAAVFNPADSPSPSSGMADRPGSRSQETAVQLAFGVWVFGAVIMTGWLFLSYSRFLLTLSQSGTGSADWQLQLDRLQQNLCCRRKVQICATDRDGPAICWTPRGYRLLVPTDKWMQLTATQREFVLRHELAHVQRGDLIRGLVHRLAASVQWFNPFAWIAVAKLDECAEWMCDEIAQTNGAEDSADYIRTLLKFSAPESRIPALIPNAAGHSLVQRAHRLLTPQVKEDSGMKKMSITLLVVVMAIVNALTVDLAAQQAAGTTDKKKSPPTTPETPTKTTVRKQSTVEETELVILQAADAPTAKPENQSEQHTDHTSHDSVDVPGTDKNNSGTAVGGTSTRNSTATTEAVIDIAYVFANLPEFTRLRNALKQEMAAEEKKLKAAVVSFRRTESKLKDPLENDLDTLRSDLAAQKARLEVQRDKAREMLKLREARMYATVYKRVRRAIAEHAKENGIHIVRRASARSEQRQKLDSDDPQAILKAMNAQVLYIADDSIDITEAVLKRLTVDETAADADSQPANHE